jgi:hypothetical protein
MFEHMLTGVCIYIGMSAAVSGSVQESTLSTRLLTYRYISVCMSVYTCCRQRRCTGVHTAHMYIGIYRRISVYIGIYRFISVPGAVSGGVEECTLHTRLLPLCPHIRLQPIYRIYRYIFISICAYISVYISVCIVPEFYCESLVSVNRRKLNIAFNT